MNDFILYCKTNWLELTSVVFSLVSVVLAAKENIGLYPTGIVAVVIAAYIYSSSKLYADTAVQVYYLMASIYGWFYWYKLKQLNKSVSLVSNSKEWLWYFLLTVFSWGVFYGALLQTDTDIPFTDSLVNALFITGMVLMARKKVENWIIWILGDIGSIFISLYKELYFFAVQYAIFTLLAAYAAYLWYAKLNEQKAA